MPILSAASIPIIAEPNTRHALTNLSLLTSHNTSITRHLERLREIEDTHESAITFTYNGNYARPAVNGLVGNVLQGADERLFWSKLSSRSKDLLLCSIQESIFEAGSIHSARISAAFHASISYATTKRRRSRYLDSWASTTTQ